MCLYPKLIRNPKYKPNKKNNYKAPELKDIRVAFVPIGCGNCIECRKQKANEWKIRLKQELQSNIQTPYFITLTFSEESLNKLEKEKKIKECNAIATIAVKRFRERYRKKYKKSIQHWLITELGHNNTERIHMHGIIWCNKEQIKEIEKIWSYGFVYIGNYCNERTINYIIKYVMKIDESHKDYKSIILTSPGIGKNYIKTIDYKNNEFKDKDTNETIRDKKGYKTNMPIYYRNKRYNEEEREKLWINKIEQHTRYVLGKKIDISTEEGIKIYERELKKAQELNKIAGYGDDTKEWQKKDYNTTNRQLNKQEKIKNLKEKKVKK